MTIAPEAAAASVPTQPVSPVALALANLRSHATLSAPQVPQPVVQNLPAPAPAPPVFNPALLAALNPANSLTVEGGGGKTKMLKTGGEFILEKVIPVVNTISTAKDIYDFAQWLSRQDTRPSTGVHAPIGTPGQYNPVAGRQTGGVSQL